MRPLTAGEQARIETAVLEAEAVRAAARTERVRVLAVTPVETDKVEGVRPGDRVLAEVILVTYASGRGLRVRVDIDSGRIVATESLPGRPQASGAERDEGERLIRSDEALGKLLEGNRLVGGFVVDPPEAGRPGRHLEYHLTDPNGRSLLREVIVDLQTRRVVVSRADREGAQKP